MRHRTRMWLHLPSLPTERDHRTQTLAQAARLLRRTLPFRPFMLWFPCSFRNCQKSRWRSHLWAELKILTGRTWWPFYFMHSLRRFWVCFYFNKEDQILLKQINVETSSSGSPPWEQHIWWLVLAAGTIPLDHQLFLLVTIWLIPMAWELLKRACHAQRSPHWVSPLFNSVFAFC